MAGKARGGEQSVVKCCLRGRVKKEGDKGAGFCNKEASGDLQELFPWPDPEGGGLRSEWERWGSRDFTNKCDREGKGERLG